MIRGMILYFVRLSSALTLFLITQFGIHITT